MSPEHLQGEVPRGHLNQVPKPPQRLHSKLPLGMSKLLLYSMLDLNEGGILRHFTLKCQPDGDARGKVIAKASRDHPLVTMNVCTSMANHNCDMFILSKQQQLIKTIYQCL